MKRANNNYRIDRSCAGENDQLLALLEETGFNGKVSMTYARRPDALASLNREGAHVDVVTIKDTRTETVAAMGAYAVNTMFDQPTRDQSNDFVLPDTRLDEIGHLSVDTIHQGR